MAAETNEEAESKFSAQLSARIEEQMGEIRSALRLMVDDLNKGQTALGEKIEQLGDRLCHQH